MRTAFYNMAVWNVQEAGDIIEDIINTEEALGKVKPVSTAEKVRLKASVSRRQERLNKS